MKKLITILMAASILFAHGCSAKTEQETTTEAETTVTAAVQVIEETEPETTVQADEEESTKLATEFSHQFKKAYYELLTSGTKPWSDFEYTDSENRYYMGILFCELFDWNLDGVPELMLGYSTDEDVTYNIEYLEVYTVENDKAEQILKTKVHASYGALDGSQNINFSYGKDGTLYLGIANEETEEMSYLGETYYTFKDGEVENTRFYAEMDVSWDDGGATSFRDFRIDGKVATEKQFNDKRNEIGAEDAFYVDVYYCEYDMLFDYLAGETDTYTNQLFSIHNYPEDVKAWMNDVDFGYEKTFTK